ncbi:PREDICTED: zinc finger protein 62 homolog [Habropoda laboriosa]|uniref:zinc finger protein 62 homolog n=1 Tax=Habropoda laboriosa TaxID=597456 RepID=UPI00083D8CFD|nr:PREDICTED: zinc finger protein 62 homolog [Habropoda laboriosa]
MFKSASFDQIDKIYNGDEITEEYEHKVNTDDIFRTEKCEYKVNDISLPKIEPLYPGTADLSDGISSIGEMVSPIPFTTPYKVKDPIIVLEKCDKIWETLQVIKNTQCRGKTDTSTELPSETTSKSLYVEYNPVLGNNNSALPNFKFSVKTKKKLFCCSTCEKRYTRNNHLRYHLERAHGILVPPKRNRNVILTKKDIEKEKEPNNVVKEKDNSEKVYLKKGESKQQASASLQSSPTSVIKCNISISNSYMQRRKRNILRRNSDQISETVKKGRERKVLNKELKQNEKSVPSQHELVSLMCVLCKQSVKNLRKHLIDYHKIESPDFMLKNLNDTSTPSGSKESKTLLSNSKALKKNPTTQEKGSLHFQKKNKRKSNMSYVNSSKRCKLNSNNKGKTGNPVGNNRHQCEICFGIYTLRSYRRHIQTHRSRGETKENFHLFSCKYINSPLFQHTLNISNTFVKNRINLKPGDKDDSNLSEDKEIERIILQNNQASHAGYNGQQETICSCGRSFRNPHTLFMHKKQCRILTDEEKDSSTDSASEYDVKKNCYDRDSGIGISITIKKKNNSYEIIDKDNKNETKFEDTSLSKDAYTLSHTSKDYTQIKSQNHPYEDLESSEYSENYSILKIQSTDEDIDIDIEEDSQTNSSNNDITSSTSKINDLHKEIKKEEIKVDQNDKSFGENVNSEVLQQKLRNRYQFNLNKLNSIQKRNNCVCGRTFYTRKALQVHITKHDTSSNLTCGYCKVSFANVIAWNEHECSISKGRKFTDIPMEITCCYCKETVYTYKQFDEHMTVKHLGSELPYQCFLCTSRFSNATFRKIHYYKEHQVTACSLCNYKCYDMMKSKHRAYHYGLGFPCHVCKKTYSTGRALIRHEWKVHPRSKISKPLLIHNKNIEIES